MIIPPPTAIKKPPPVDIVPAIIAYVVAELATLAASAPEYVTAYGPTIKAAAVTCPKRLYHFLM